jgi:hypothetical protein
MTTRSCNHSGLHGRPLAALVRPVCYLGAKQEAANALPACIRVDIVAVVKYQPHSLHYPAIAGG